MRDLTNETEKRALGSLYPLRYRALLHTLPGKLFSVAKSDSNQVNNLRILNAPYKAGKSLYEKIV